MKMRWSVVPALVLPAAAMAASMQAPTFSTRLEAVRVDVLVTDKGQPVRGLRPADFDVLDNGVPQTVDLVSFEQIPLDVILALDMSSSVAGERLDHLRVAGRAVLDQLKKDDQAALVTFSHAVALGAALTADVEPVRAALDRVQADGDTALIDGTYAGMMLGESDAGRGLLIVFSDGVDTSSWLSSDKALETARRTDVVVYSVSLRGPGKTTFLRDLSAATGGSLFELESTKNLSAVFVGILDEFRHRYLVSYSPRGVSKEGWHRLEVRVKGGRAAVKARPGYLAGSAR
jgi:VWFA-related protein